MATYFDKILDQSSGDEPFKWFRNRIKEFGTPSRNQLMREGKITATPNFGRMNLFFYDPKYKNELPYYDKFPLVIPIDTFDGGFVGINFHYLPYAMRATLLDRMVDIGAKGELTDKTKLNIAWNDVRKIRQVKPCVKKYLFSQMRSPFRRINADEFMLAAMLPVQQFAKQSDTRVWADSRKMM
jgi:hypothetical protein